jgi:hypothetical protein
MIPILKLRAWLLPALLILMLIPGCGDDESSQNKFPTAPPPSPFVEDSLVFRRLDGTVIAMGDSTLNCCGLFDPGFVDEHAIRVMYWDPALQKNSWQILILTAATTPGSVHTLPTAPVAPHKMPAVSLFVHGGEYSSSTEQASGTITLHSFECGVSTMSVDFSVDAVLDAEIAGGGQITVKGRFRGVFPRTTCPE